MDKATCYKIFEAIDKHTESSESDLNYTNNYTLLTAVLLSAQTKDERVNMCTEELFKLADNPADMVKLGEEKVRDYIKSLGFYKTKAKNVIAMSQSLLDNFGGQIPDNRKDLESLAGVGRKTANVVLNIAFNQPAIAVDTHVFRIGNRIGVAEGKKNDEVEQKFMEVIPEEFALTMPNKLVLHGRYVCKARKPECENCPLTEWCKHYNEQHN